MSEDTIISCLSNDLFVEPNLIVEEIMTASNLKASLRLAVEDFANYPMLLEKLASKFQCLPSRGGEVILSIKIECLPTPRGEELASNYERER